MEIIYSKDVITRKPHKCYYCTRTFPIKTKMQTCVSKDNGSVSKSYLCKQCMNLLSAMTDCDIEYRKEINL